MGRPRLDPDADTARIAVKIPRTLLKRIERVADDELERKLSPVVRDLIERGLTARET